MSRVLIAGATGRLAAPVVAQLVAEGHSVFALVRDTAKARQNPQLDAAQLINGDVCDFDSVDRTMADSGCDAVYISLSSDTFDPAQSAERVGVEHLTTAAAARDIGWIGYLSGAGDLSSQTQLRPLAIKHHCEAVVANGGVPYTIFKPSHFFESLPWFLHRGKLSIPGKQPHLYHYLACSDFARIVAFALADIRCHGLSMTVHGPHAMTMAEALTGYRDLCLPDTAIGTLPLWMARVIGTVSRNTELHMLAELFGAFAAHGDDGEATVPCSEFPQPTTTLQEWARP